MDTGSYTAKELLPFNESEAPVVYGLSQVDRSHEIGLVLLVDVLLNEFLLFITLNRELRSLGWFFQHGWQTHEWVCLLLVFFLLATQHFSLREAQLEGLESKDRLS